MGVVFTKRKHGQTGVEYCMFLNEETLAVLKTARQPRSGQKVDLEKAASHERVSFKKYYKWKANDWAVIT